MQLHHAFCVPVNNKVASYLNIQTNLKEPSSKLKLFRSSFTKSNQAESICIESKKEIKCRFLQERNTAVKIEYN